MESRVLTIMFTDIKGFTESSGRRSRQAVLDLVNKHDELLRPVIDHFAGRIVKTIGDAFLVVFDSPTNGVLCGLLMQYRLQEYNQSVPEEEQIEIRIALNSGEVQLTEDDIYGEPVNVAARINAITEPNEVYFTETVFLSMNRQEAPSSEVGERKLKGIDYPITVYKVIQDPRSDQYRQVLSRFKGVLTSPETPPRERSHSVTKPGPLPAMVSRKPLMAGAFLVAAAGALAGVGLWQSGFFGPGWAEEVQTHAERGAFEQAWSRLDEQYDQAPGDDQLATLANETLTEELDHLRESEGLEAATQRLESHQEQRPYIEDIDTQLSQTRQDWAQNLLEKDTDEARTQAVKQLGLVADAHPDVAEKRLDYALALGNWDQPATSDRAEVITDLLADHPSVAKEEELKALTMELLTSGNLRPERDGAREFFAQVAEHYPEAVTEKFGDQVTDPEDTRMRETAFAVLDKTDKDWDASEVFEYHRLNLFQFDGSMNETGVRQAIDYFEEHSDERDQYTEWMADIRCEDAESLRQYGHHLMDDILDVFSQWFYAPCEDFLREAVTREGDASLRYHAYLLLMEQDTVASDTRSRYHMLNLREHRETALVWQYPWVEQALAYISEGGIEDPAQVETAREELEDLRSEISRVRESDGIRHNEQSLEWLEGDLAEAEAGLP